MDDPRDAPVAVAKGVHAGDVEMRHRGAHGDVDVEVAPLEPSDELTHELRNVLVGRTDVRRRSAARVRDLDAVAAVLARVLVLLEVAGVEVQVEDDAVRQIERREQR